MFIKIIKIGDDLYLLRLLHLTGPILEKLTLEVGKSVLYRINAISRSHQIQKITLRWIKKAYDSNFIQLMKPSDQNEFLETIYEYSFLNSQIGEKATLMYKALTFT